MPRGLLGFLIWLAAAGAAGLLWWHTEGPREPFPGLVGGLPTVLGSARAGRVQAVTVAVGDAVAAGAVVLQLDPGEAEGLLQVAEAEWAAAQADVAAEAAGHRAEARLLALDLGLRATQARAAIDDARARQTAAQGELRSLSAALGKLRGVAEAGLARGDQVADLESRRARLQGEASYGPEALEAWRAFEDRLAAAGQATSTEVPAELEDRLRPFRAREEQARRQVEALRALRAECTLRAPHAGQVARVLVGPGAAVVPGLPLVELVGPAGADVVDAWLPEERARLLAVGAEVLLVPRDRHAEPVKGQVERLGPALELLPERLWLDQNSPRYGRPLRVRAAAPLLPGEAVQVAPR